MKIIKAFVKNNKVIFICFCLSLIVIVIYMILRGGAGMLSHSESWFNLLFQFSVGFEINFVFYITQVYIPQYNQKLQAKKCIAERIAFLERKMSEVFEQVCGTIDDSVTKESFLGILNQLDVGRRVRVVNSEKIGIGGNTEDAHFTTSEWIISRVEYVESEIDKIFKYYSPYVSPRLMRCLEDILKSAMHRNMARSLLRIPFGVSFAQCKEDIFFEPYYCLMKELEQIRKNYLE